MDWILRWAGVSVVLLAAPVIALLFWLGDTLLEKFGGKWGKRVAAEHRAQGRMDDQAGRPLF